VHDITEMEASGIPAVLVASSEFELAVKAQADAFGFAPAVVFVPHPIQDRTDEELRALADGAIDRLLSSLTR
jgi:alkanesulfonate monooxygenase SsuD/methylene tetrahydromethanopterin reductase-like flavin-dependent oxidoreductase (luciferase family)